VPNAAPTRDEIKPRVIAVLATVSGVASKKIKESDVLADDLGLTEPQRGALAPDLRDLARAYQPGAVIGLAACKKLETVKEAIDLVFKKAGGK
jgi:hypothetical protein